MTEGPAKCFTYTPELAASQPAPAWEGGRGLDSLEEHDCASYVLCLLVRAEENFRDLHMARPAGLFLKETSSVNF